MIPSCCDQDAQKAIPKGTLLAIIISGFVYVIVAWMAGSCVIRDATGPLNATVIAMLPGAMVSENCSTDSCLIDSLGYEYYSNCSLVNGMCNYGLSNHFQVRVRAHPIPLSFYPLHGMHCVTVYFYICLRGTKQPVVGMVYHD